MATFKREFTHFARKRFGQHFLHDQTVIAHIARVIAAKPGDLLVEIGPGLGALTQVLLPIVQRMHAVELDRDVIPKLQGFCLNMGELIIHQADALKFSLHSIPQNTTPVLIRVVGNLPYNISTPLIFHLLEEAQLIQDMHFMLQKEVVDRLAAGVGDDAYGRLSVMVQYYCSVQHLFDVGPEAFSPPPKVDSAIVRLIPHRQLPIVAQDPALFAKLVTAAFGQRRKTLRNSLKLWTIDWEAVGIAPSARAEELSVKDFVTIANALTSQ